MSKANNTVTLPQRMDISAVSEIYLTLSAALEKNKPIVMDAAAVERIDASGLQMLLAFVLQANMQSVNCLWESPSAVFVKSGALLGLNKQLGIE